jgi:hypothetical protein
LLPLLLSLLPAYLPAQGQGHVVPAGWSVAVGADGLWFGRAASDTGAPAEQSADLRPSGRAGLRVTLARTLGEWRAQLELGLAQGDAEARNRAVAIRDRTLDLSRYRLAVGLERAVTAVGAGEIALALAPTLDLWRAGGESRVRWGLEARGTLRLPLGPLALENRLGLGWSGAPLDEVDLIDDFDRHALRTLVFGVGLRMPI